MEQMPTHPKLTPVNACSPVGREHPDQMLRGLLAPLFTIIHPVMGGNSCHVIMAWMGATGRHQVQIPTQLPNRMSANKFAAQSSEGTLHIFITPAPVGNVLCVEIFIQSNITTTLTFYGAGVFALTFPWQLTDISTYADGAFLRLA